MRDPYRNVYGEYTPMTYTIGSRMGKGQKSLLVLRSNQASFSKAAKNFTDGITRMGETFKEVTAAIVKASA
ncbi:hypothetical protein SEA_AVAZAK_51 [Gordonia phage Avazak]|uniref:Uncharacterized protein n=1 Tax=Gordonia phage Avazak TaxID=2656529 RepID=A0A649V6M5_9CAUD|nr:hypothetical protein HWC78_gp51 [Gordonia phage Avazak]QGJ88031.1 hypothetical protein SEA_AVAZAK_51 [Gordonia phage Avazak]WNM72519.1 hypothetical protein SEA_ARTORIAS_50 [Gordonia phage Artorias]